MEEQGGGNGGQLRPPPTGALLKRMWPERALVYGLLLGFALFSGFYTWYSVLQFRTEQITDLDRLAEVGMTGLIADYLHRLDTETQTLLAMHGRREILRPADKSLLALSLRGADGQWRTLFGSPVPVRLRGIPCPRPDGCILEVQPVPGSRVGQGVLWLRRPWRGQTIYAASSIVVLQKLWRSIPQRAADALFLRPVGGKPIQIWPLRVMPGAIRVVAWAPVNGSKLELGVGALASSLHRRWREIIWPGMLFLLLVLLLAEAAIRAAERRSALTQAKILDNQHQISRIKNLYSTLSDANQLIIHHPDPQTLFNTVCRLLVDRVGINAAYIGWLDAAAVSGAAKEESGVRWVAWAAQGKVDGDLSCQPQPGVVEHVQMTGAMGLESAPMACKHSSCCTHDATQVGFPIRQQDRIVALLWLCVGRRMIENQEVQDLLRELVGDLGYSLEDNAQRQQLRYAAYHDRLTGLANDLHLLETLRTAGEQPGTQGILIALAFRRINEINATYGWDAGDGLMRVAAQRLQVLGGAYPGGLAARVGGNHLFLLLPGIDGVQAKRLIREVVQRLAEPILLGDVTLYNSEPHAGWACWPEHWDGAERLLVRAELALEMARSLTGAELCVVRFASEMEETVREAGTVRREFSRALAQGDLVLYYQPILNLTDGCITGMESLIRWIGSDGVVRPPNRFIPYIEQDAQCLRALGRFVLDQGLAQVTRWSRAGLVIDVAVNIGASHLVDPAFIDDLRAALEAHPDAAPEHLTIELTESAYLGAPEVASAVLKKVRALGIRVALDDFGTAYASLSYLQQLPVDRIKVDISFTQQLLKGQRAEAIISGVIMTARLLGIEVIAEGVETEDQAHLLRHMGCDKLQGYRIARPMPANEADTWLQAWNPAPWANAEDGVLEPLLAHARMFYVVLQDWACVKQIKYLAVGEAEAVICSWLREEDEFRLVFERFESASERERWWRIPEVMRDNYLTLLREAQMLVSGLGQLNEEEVQCATDSLAMRFETFMYNLARQPFPLTDLRLTGPRES